MLYILAIIAPPVAVLLTGRPFTALLNLGLTFLMWIPGVIHALFVLSEHKADKRFSRLVDTFNQQNNHT
ncbi:MAG: YqaE/Pmp3 family membrane protein [Chloroflexi bacterium]|nr:YqaE/Pmp3 family membrane protein [Chloroflexota bacterium]